MEMRNLAKARQAPCNLERCVEVPHTQGQALHGVCAGVVSVGGVHCSPGWHRLAPSEAWCRSRLTSNPTSALRRPRAL